MTTTQPEQPTPAVGDKYVCTTETGDRTVTVTRVGQNIDGPAVEFEWRDPQSPLYGAGLTLAVFLGTYKPVCAPEPTVTVTEYGISDGISDPETLTANTPESAEHVRAAQQRIWPEQTLTLVQRTVTRTPWTPTGGEQA